MKAKDMAKFLGYGLAIWHVIAIVKDAERCKVNLDGCSSF
jgi:hypothetical protein